MVPMSSDFSTLRNRTSRPTGTIMAPPSPCSTRAAVSSAALPDSPHRIEPKVNSAMAARKMVRPPKRSGAQPDTGTNTARLSRYAVTATLRRTGSACSETAICGSAVVITVESICCMMIAEPTIIATILVLAWGVMRLWEPDSGSHSTPRTLVLCESRAAARRRSEAGGRLGRQQLLHFVDQLAQMDRLGQHLGVFGRGRVGIKRHRGKAGDEHDLDVGVELGGAARELDAVHLGHHDVGEQQLERLLAQPLVGRPAVVVGNDIEAGILQRLDQEAPHVEVVFRKQDFGHSCSKSGGRRPPSSHKPDAG